MNKETHFHVMHYLLLIAVIGLGIISFFIYSGNPQKQFLVIIVTSVLYFLWGIYHHSREGDLHAKIVVEYLLIAIIAVLLLRGAIFH